MRYARLAWSAWILPACSPAPAPAPAEAPTARPTGPTAPAGTAAPVAWSAYEAGLLEPLLADLRAGVRPWDEQSIGLCRGKRTCDDFLGAHPGILPPGDYVLRAVLAVPQLGAPGDWTAALDTTCTITGVDASGVRRTRTIRDHQDHLVRYAGPNEGFHLEPLLRLTSPSPAEQACTWTLALIGPETRAEVSGDWAIPAATPP